jgi:hypothetical protein
MWFECLDLTCNFCTNSPGAAVTHETETGHMMITEIDWTDNEEEVF